MRGAPKYQKRYAARSSAERPVNRSLATTPLKLATTGSGAAWVMQKMTDFVDRFGERAGTRTQDLLIKSQLLYRLSYALVTKARS
jgi:hypothetical protein